MGYESRIYVGLRYHHEGTDKDFATKVATFYLSKMGFDFPHIFNKPIDFEMYIDDSDDVINEDCYGCVCKYTDIDTVLKYLEDEIANGNDYRRLLMFHAFVKNLKDNISVWEIRKDNMQSTHELVFVHYGY